MMLVNSACAIRNSGGPVRIEFPLWDILAQRGLAGNTGPRFELPRMPLQRGNQAEIVKNARPQGGGDLADQVNQIAYERRARL